MPFDTHKQLAAGIPTIHVHLVAATAYSRSRPGSGFREAGVTDLFGIDGPYVDPARTGLAANEFIPHDLTQPLKLPAYRNRRSQLANLFAIPFADAWSMVQIVGRN